MIHKEFLIDGQLVTGNGDLEPVLAPADESLIYELASATAAQLDEAVDAAERAFAGWSRTPPGKRA
ncbi:hypothetical protein NS383_24045, partial [Pseudomonas oryzihabitans]